MSVERSKIVTTLKYFLNILRFVVFKEEQNYEAEEIVSGIIVPQVETNA